MSCELGNTVGGKSDRDNRHKGVIGHLGGASLREHKHKDVSWVQSGSRVLIRS